MIPDICYVDKGAKARKCMHRPRRKKKERWLLLCARKIRLDTTVEDGAEKVNLVSRIKEISSFTEKTKYKNQMMMQTRLCGLHNLAIKELSSNCRRKMVRCGWKEEQGR